MHAPLALVVVISCGAPEEAAPAVRDVQVELPTPALAREAAAAAERAQAHEAEEARADAARRAERRSSPGGGAEAGEPQVRIVRGNVSDDGGTKTLRPFSGATWLQGRATDDGDLLVVFWQPWCPACRAELPKLQAWGGEGVVEVVAVTSLSRGATERSAEAALEAAGFRLPVAVIPRSTEEAVGLDSFPHAVLLRDQRVVWSGHPADARRRIRKLLR